MVRVVNRNPSISAKDLEYLYGSVADLMVAKINITTLGEEEISRLYVVSITSISNSGQDEK